jgi:putative phosphoserine phosphatase/1-acylglycerol-3-phosphate O-acyltransferase
VLISSGTLDVAVLPPVPTKDWNRDDIDREVERVRDMYLETLAHWPR